MTMAMVVMMMIMMITMMMVMRRRKKDKSSRIQVLRQRALELRHRLEGPCGDVGANVPVL